MTSTEYFDEEALFNPDDMTENAAAPVAPTVQVQPFFPLSAEEKFQLSTMERRLKARIIGQDAAISVLCRAIKRNKVGFKDPARPVGSFIFLGTSGVGKTALCRALAEVLYGDEKKLIKLDMSEFMFRWDATKLTGAAPGYTGYENGGQLTNFVKLNPHAVLCFDEIEKADPDIFNIFLQVMEDGRLTSGKGEAVSFRDILIIMTSNIGSEIIVRNNKPIGFGADYDGESEKKNKITAALKRTFKPEFLNRIDEVITFNRLNEKQVLQICRIMLKKVKQRAQNINIKLEFDKSAVAELARLGFDKEYGARPLRRVITAQIEDMLAEKVLAGELNAGDDVRIIFNESGFAAEKKMSAEAMEGLW
jgi:ATP-dependent Clp protease ATP-binding subunit ClpC